MVRYYKVDGQKLSYPEYWRMSPEPLSFLIAALRKLLRIPVEFRFSIPRVDSLDLLDPAEIPARVKKKWRAMIGECEDQGLQVQFYYTLPVLEDTRESYAVTLLSDDGLVATNVTYAGTPSIEKTAFSCLSKLRDGHCLITSSQPKQMEPCPEDEIDRLPGRSPADLLAHHREKISSSADSDRTPVRLNESKLQQLVLQREQGHVDFHIERGVYVPMTKTERRRLLASSQDEGADEED
jgi:hypothetical protein